MIAKTTNGVTIRVRKKFLDEHSQPQDHKFNFAYHVTITNERSETVQLVNRYWSIRSSNGQVRIVEGEGVIGQQPLINSGDSYQYNSWCPLDSRFGVMSGHYEMEEVQSGVRFKAEIPEFALEYPPMLN